MDPKLMQILYHSVQTFNILPITSVCNVRCLFCSHQQNPRGIKAIGLPPLSLEIIEELLDFLDGKKKIVIGESASLIMEGEPFTHPYFFNCLELIRKKFPRTLIQLTTNGSYLDQNTVKRLLEFEPLELNLSLNIADPNLRRSLMKDKRAEVACDAPKILKQFEITYHGSIVAMPHITGWKNLYHALKSLSDNGATTIRVFKPGFTKFAPEHLEIPKNVFKELEQNIAEWRNGLCPITLEPPVLSDLIAEVVGVIDKSPAFKAGIKAGDVIIEINGNKPFSRVEAYQELKRNGTHHLVVKRENKCFSLKIEITEEKSGLVFDYDISLEEVEEIKKVLMRFNAQRPLLMASKLGYKILQTGLLDVENLQIIPVTNHFFGGSIQCAGLLVMKDMKRAYEDYIETNSHPDLLLLPAIAFDFYDRDLAGEGIWELEEIAKCPVVTI